MPRISGEVILNCLREKAYNELSSFDFAERMDLSFDRTKREILFQNQRLTRTLARIENIGTVEMERILIPETFTIVSKRIPPMAPFSYFLGLQIFVERGNGAVLKWIEEFDLEEESKANEPGILAGLERHEREQFQKIGEYYDRIGAANDSFFDSDGAPRQHK